jgi:hypothetical protein
MTGWWYTYPSEKYEFVSWDYYSQYMESHEIHVPNYGKSQLLIAKSTISMTIFHSYVSLSDGINIY